MAIKPAALSPVANIRATVTESIEDPVSRDRMINAVTVVPCGHIFNEDTVINCLARNKLCPLDRRPIERYVPNYNIRSLAANADVDSLEDTEPTEEAQAYFLQAKELSDKENYEEAVTVLLQALRVSPDHKKAQAYLDFCLRRSSQPLPSPIDPPKLPSLPRNSSLEKKEKIEEKSLSKTPKSQYTDLLLILLDEPQIQNNVNLKKILEKQIEELMSQEAEELTPKQKETYKWTDKLFVDNKIRQFVAEKLQQIYGGSSSLPEEKKRAPIVHVSSVPAPASASLSPLPHASSIAVPSPAKASGLFKHIALTSPALLEVKKNVTEIAFGRKKWAIYFGDIGEEPPLPANIQEILKGPCPLWPGKRVEETHLLTLIPETVNGKPLTLNSLEELIKHPKQGHMAKFNYQGYEGRIKEKYGDVPTNVSSYSRATYWILLTKDVIPGTRSISFGDVRPRFSNFQYSVPTLLEITVSLFMEYAQTGTRLYSDNPLTYTYCEGSVNSSSSQPEYLYIGGFAPDGLKVQATGFSVYGNPNLGVAGSWRLTL